jgi:hypothetical protein
VRGYSGVRSDRPGTQEPVDRHARVHSVRSNQHGSPSAWPTGSRLLPECWASSTPRKSGGTRVRDILPEPSPSACRSFKVPKGPRDADTPVPPPRHPAFTPADARDAGGRRGEHPGTVLPDRPGIIVIDERPWLTRQGELFGGALVTTSGSGGQEDRGRAQVRTSGCGRSTGPDGRAIGGARQPALR